MPFNPCLSSFLLLCDSDGQGQLWTICNIERKPCQRGQYRKQSPTPCGTACLPPVCLNIAILHGPLFYCYYLLLSFISNRHKMEHQFTEAGGSGCLWGLHSLGQGWDGGRVGGVWSLRKRQVTMGLYKKLVFPNLKKLAKRASDFGRRDRGKLEKGEFARSWYTDKIYLSGHTIGYSVLKGEKGLQDIQWGPCLDLHFRGCTLAGCLCPPHGAKSPSGLCPAGLTPETWS